METKKDWYKDAVVYQIYPKSFCDSNGDGIGDFRGIISKLDYLKELGVNTVWISPCYPTPDKDNGYDISDFDNVDPKFGTMADFEEMLDEMHKRGIRLLMDLVVNHTSDEHEWFKSAIQGKDAPYRDYYIWKDPVNGGPPNKWGGDAIGGSAWIYDEKSGQYYLHVGFHYQPDLDWENPKVRDEIANMINRWFDRGVDGFRCDVINMISKDFEADHPGDGPRLHEFLHELHERCFGPHNAFTVGEVWDLPPEASLMLTAPEREELTLAFQFEHMREGREKGLRFYPAKFDPHKFVATMAKWQAGLNGKGWNALCIENHDQPRSIDRFGSKKYRRESAKLLATLTYCMQGTPFIYEGQELGCINPVFHTLEESIDIESQNNQDILIKKFGVEETLRRFSLDSRDCGRVPMAWDDSENGGFTTGKPWIKLNDFYKDINAKNELSAEDGVYGYFRDLFKMRAANKTLMRGDFELLKNEGGAVVYRRFLEGEKDVYVVLNYSDKRISIDNPVKGGKFLITSHDRKRVTETFRMRPWESIVIS
ncbi:MAG: alpha-glucosidase [Clostridia bacterium]|nr:alpha-glucosidase [Clostridia bacterium]